MGSATVRSRKAGVRRPGASLAYWSAPRQPLYCLVFLFPLVGAYEFGALILRPVAWPERQLVAHTLLRGFLGLFGAGGVWVPGVALLLTLLIWHLISRRPWQVRAWVLLLMLFECLVLTVPLFVLNRVMLQAGAEGSDDLRLQIVLALGAGVYEELVFRLGLISLLGLLFVDVGRMPRRPAALLIVVLAAVAFALCHVQPVGAEPFVWSSFLMRAAAGGYLSIVFLTRGLGVATGCHAAYNLALLGWSTMWIPV